MTQTTMTRDQLIRNHAASVAARRQATIDAQAGAAAGQAELALLMGLGAFGAPVATPRATKRLVGTTLYHAKHADKCKGVDRASIPSFKDAAVGQFVIASVGEATKTSGQTYERMEAIRRFCGQSLAAYAAAGGDRNWLGYFADRGKVVVELAA